MKQYPGFPELNNETSRILDDAEAYYELNMLFEALAEIEKLPPNFDEKCAAVWKIKCACFIYSNEPEKALPYAEKLLAWSPNFPSTMANHIGVLLHLERFGEARAALTVAVERHPDDPGLMLEMARFYARTEDLRQAKLWLDKATAGNPIGNIYQTARQDELFEKVLRPPT